jgi:hypothetical protein
MSEEAPPPPRYRLLARGVRDEIDGAEFTADDTVRWPAYLAWLASGNAPLPMIVAPIPTGQDYAAHGLARAARQFNKLSPDDAVAALLEREGYE